MNFITLQLFSKEYVNMLLSCYFVILGVLALAHITGSVIIWSKTSLRTIDYVLTNVFVQLQSLAENADTVHLP